jgi:hypothetical protein
MEKSIVVYTICRTCADSGSTCVHNSKHVFHCLCLQKSAWGCEKIIVLLLIDSNCMLIARARDLKTESLSAGLQYFGKMTQNAEPVTLSQNIRCVISSLYTRNSVMNRSIVANFE